MLVDHGLRHHHRERLVRVSSMTDRLFVGLPAMMSLCSRMGRLFCESVSCASPHFLVPYASWNLRIDLEPLLGRRS